MTTLKLPLPIRFNEAMTELRVAKGAWTQDAWNAYLWRQSRQQRASAHQRRAAAQLEHWRQSQEPDWSRWRDGNGYDAFGNFHARDTYSPLPHEDDLHWEQHKWNS